VSGKVEDFYGEIGLVSAFFYENMKIMQNMMNIFQVAIAKRSSLTIVKTSTNCLGGPNIDSSPFFGNLKFNIAAEFIIKVRLIMMAEIMLFFF